jgi:hypothetical protein
MILVTPAPNGNKAGIFIYRNKDSFEGNFPKFFTWFDGDINTAKKPAEKTVSRFYGNENVRKEDIEKYTGSQISRTPYYDIERGEDFKRLSHILETGESQTIQNKKLGDEIYIDKGLTGKDGYGLLHIIEGRYVKDKHNIDEITAILYKVTDSAENGYITDSIIIKNKDNDKRIGIEKDGIIAIIDQGKETDNEKFVITGYELNKKKEEAAEAIRTVIARYGYTPEFSDFRKQAGAVVSSLQVSHQLNDKSREIETARKAGYVQGVCECVAAIGEDHALGKKLLTEMNVTKDTAKKYAGPDTFKALEQGIFAPKTEQKQEQTRGIKR